jgi:uncharacterized protein
MLKKGYKETMKLTNKCIIISLVFFFFHFVHPMDYDRELQKKYLDFNRAIQKEDKNLIESFLNAGIGLNIVDAYAGTPLHWAIRKGSNEIIEVLLKFGAHIDKADNVGHTPLHWAVIEKSADLVKLLLKAGADVDKKDANGYTPLHMAVLYECEDIVGILCEAGAELAELKENKEHYNAQDQRGRTPLMSACKNGNLEIVDKLLTHKVNLDAQDSNGCTALMFAICASRIDKEVADTNKKAKLEIYGAIVQKLLQAGADIALENNADCTALDIATACNRNRIVRMLSSRC